MDKGTSQTIQGDVKKPKEPSKEKLTDPTKKPDGEKLEEPPENVDHDKVKKPEEAPKKKMNHKVEIRRMVKYMYLDLAGLMILVKEKVLRLMVMEI